MKKEKPYMQLRTNSNKEHELSFYDMPFYTFNNLRDNAQTSYTTSADIQMNDAQIIELFQWVVEYCYSKRKLKKMLKEKGYT